MILIDIPYAIGQFTVTKFITKSLSAPCPRKHGGTSGATKFSIHLGSGIIAGFAAAVLSHPADTLLSQIEKGHGPVDSTTHRLSVLGRQAGLHVCRIGLKGGHDCGTGIWLVLVWKPSLKQALNPPGIEIRKEKNKMIS